jgi:hypothetical protein
MFILALYVGSVVISSSLAAEGHTAILVKGTVRPIEILAI